MQLNEALNRISPPDETAKIKAKQRLDSIIKPLDSLGILETHLVKIAGITGRADFHFGGKTVVVFCADNGIVAQNITQSTREVTAIVAENLATGDTCVCAMGDTAGARIVPVDIGIAKDMDVPGLLNRKVMYGTEDFTVRPAMTREQAVRGVEAGIRLAMEQKEGGARMLATGEMGIGNTTTASAMAAVLLGCPVETVTGRGAGLSDEGLNRKIAVIRQGIALHRPDSADPLDVLSKVGGLDIAGMAGLCIGGALCRVPVVLDGVISCVAALAACRLNPLVKEYILPSHVSAEPAGGMLLDALGLEAPLHARMRLGEGTGAVATFPLYDMILSVYNRMVAFEDENMDAYVPLG